MAKDNPLSAEHLFEHVQDQPHLHVPRGLGHNGHIEIPQPFQTTHPLWEMDSGNPTLDNFFLPFDLQLTKFMLIELGVAIVIAVLFIGLAARIRYGGPPKGRLWNLLEAMYMFIRDQVARPAIGHDADRFLPFLLTLFFFILGCNLAGMIPWLGSPTGVMATTAALALVTFAVTVGSGIKQLGFAGFLKAQVPHMELPGALKWFLVPMIWVIEVLGLMIKHAVLAVRLLANMMAGHIVLAVILGFIAFAAIEGGPWLASGVAPVSTVAVIALSLLELFVAFLQAYVFVFLAALFIGAAVHPH
ncbi:F0F1 ATP synthase subunit A [Aeoliella sp.]|uniref:F0F1 ATP synthase subunit A n=1 Tax=Aeoliella sp. TaxID=2795800 RepID=UPI003CCBB7E7